MADSNSDTNNLGRDLAAGGEDPQAENKASRSVPPPGCRESGSMPAPAPSATFGELEPVPGAAATGGTPEPAPRSAATVGTPEPAPGAAATVGTPTPVPNRRPVRRRRRRLGGGLSLVLGALAALYFLPALREQVPASVPLVGKNADSVYEQLLAAGVPVADGVPADADFRRMVDENACESSRPFVRSDAEQGWGLICVKPPADAFRRTSDTYNEMPMLLGPLYVEDGGGEVVVFGFGWPGNASEMIADAINADGEYLVQD